MNLVSVSQTEKSLVCISIEMLSPVEIHFGNYQLYDTESSQTGWSPLNLGDYPRDMC